MRRSVKPALVDELPVDPRGHSLKKLALQPLGLAPALGEGVGDASSAR